MSYSDKRLKDDFRRFLEEIKEKTGKEKVVFVGIGTGKCIGDSLGPLVGTMLEKKGYEVLGTLDKQAHALTLDGYIRLLEDEYSDYVVVAIDACIGDKDTNIERVGDIVIQNKPIKPGLGVGKSIKEIGDIGIRCIVFLKDEYSYLANDLYRVPLPVVYNMSDRLTNILDDIMKENKRTGLLKLLNIANML